MATKRRKRGMSWDEIGEAIGRKMEKKCKDKDTSFFKRWEFHHHEHGGGFGRFLFIIGVLYAMDYMGTISLASIPLWMLALIVIGFTAMQF